MILLPSEDVLGYHVINAGRSNCLSSIRHWIEHGDECHWLATINPHSFVVATHNFEFSEALHSADWLIPDGTGFVYASLWQQGSIRERVTGSDIFWGVHELLNQDSSWSVFFLGSTQDTLDEISNRMKRDYPNIRVAGSCSPPFKETFSDEENDRLLSAINAVKPDVLWVGMTAPKQELWLHRNKHRLNVKFAAAVGAVFDFYSGRVQRSSLLMQRLGLEWLPRLFRDPRRLWKRMFISAPIFIWSALTYTENTTKKQNTPRN